jgi:outer membrane protein
MTRKWLLLALVFAVVPLRAADVKIGYIYSDQIMKEYRGMSEPNAALGKEKAAFKQKADSLYQILAKVKSDFESQKLLLSEDAKAAKSAEIEEAERRYDSHVNEVYGPNGKLEQKTEELMAPVIKKIQETVEKLAKDDGFQVVFDAAESKLAIIYAAAGTNLTKEVLDELNREYAPVSASGVAEKRYAVCPLTEANDEAQQANLGEECRTQAYDLIRVQPHTQMVLNSDLSSALLNRGVTGKANITEQLVYSIGKDIQADYIFFGSVSKSGKKITITLKIADPRLNKAFPEEVGIANRIEELRQPLGNMIPKLLRKLPQE